MFLIAQMKAIRYLVVNQTSVANIAKVDKHRTAVCHQKTTKTVTS